MDIITFNLEQKIKAEGPLARRMRPENLDQFIGQEKILAEGKPLRTLILRDKVVSLVFYGPPGTGKTSLARIIATTSKADFIQLNAVTSGVKDVREVIKTARDNWSLHSRRTILFIDEIHRFNKAQQDVLLSAVEQGTVIFIGATTENPFFYLTGPLLSRTRLFTFEALTVNDLVKMLTRALQDQQRGLGRLRVAIAPEALNYLADKSEGDARAALNALETAVLAADRKGDLICLSLEDVSEAMQKRLLAYDRQGDNHYDMASALIKSIRGSDPDAALYWMARMISGGEDPLFIARRLIISAAEDIGNADPQALPLAVAAAQAVQMIGMPEGRIPLAQAAVYLAGALKSNASYLAINRALELVEKEKNHVVPKHLKDSSYRGARQLGHGQGYCYPHDYPGHYVEQDYLPAALRGKKFYYPTEQGKEKDIACYLDKICSKAKTREKQSGREE
jgi:putative ATPase